MGKQLNNNWCKIAFVPSDSELMEQMQLDESPDFYQWALINYDSSSKYKLGEIYRWVQENNIDITKYGLGDVISLIESQEIPSSDIVIKDLELRVLDSSEAKKFMAAYHYAGNFPRVKFALGFFWEDQIVCVICYSSPIGRLVAQSILEGGTDSSVLELTRLFSFDWTPKNLESYCIGKSVKWIEQNLPEIDALVSYADPGQGHVGVVYQASNWIYTGQGASTGGKRYEYFVDGRWMHSRTAYQVFGTASPEKLNNILGYEVPIRESLDKYKYIYLLGGKRKKRENEELLKLEPQPYPRKDELQIEAQVEHDTVPDNADIIDAVTEELNEINEIMKQQYNLDKPDHWSVSDNGITEISGGMQVFPEYYLTGFSPQNAISQQTATHLAEGLGDGLVIAGYVERDGDDFFSSAIVVDVDGNSYNVQKSESWGQSEDWLSDGSGPQLLKLSIGNTLVLLCADAFENRFGARYKAQEMWGESSVDWVVVPSAWEKGIEKFLVKRGLWRLSRAVGNPKWVISDVYNDVLYSWNWWQHIMEQVGQRLIEVRGTIESEVLSGDTIDLWNVTINIYSQLLKKTDEKLMLLGFSPLNISSIHKEVTQEDNGHWYKIAQSQAL